MNPSAPSNPTALSAEAKEPVRRFTLASWLSIYGRHYIPDFVRESDYAKLELENIALAKSRTDLRKALLGISGYAAQEIEDASDACEILGPILNTANFALTLDDAAATPPTKAASGS